MQFGFVIDNRKCIGCHACTVACKSEHDIPLGVNRTYVKTVEKGIFPEVRRTFTVTRCNHCTDSPCTVICPTSALFTRRDGIVDFDSERCIACRSCMQACPYDALYIDPQSHTAAKCNYCAHRIENGYEPACVIVCPVEAIVSGDLEDPQSKIAQLVHRESVTVRKPEKNTKPRLFYVEGDDTALNPLAAVPLANTPTTSQAAGVGHYADYVEDRLSKASFEDIFPPETSDSEPTIGGLTLSRSAVARVSQEIGEGRRVYDTPDKGILWGWQVPAYIWTKAIASGTFLSTFLAESLGVGLTGVEATILCGVSLLFLALTGALLIHDLDRPDRFLYVLLRPNWSSWLVRGAYTITGFGAVLAAQFLILWTGGQPPPWLEAPGLLLAALSSVYTAFLFAQAKARDLWQSPIAVLRMLNQAVIAGTVVVMLVHGSGNEVLLQVLVGTVTLNVLIVMLEVWSPHGSADAHAAVEIIKHGACRDHFIAGILVGNLLPVALIVLGAGPILTGVAGILLLGGIFLTEMVWVKAPQMVPLA